jgi:prepilin-type N-terminal cleavage/methylation domain-containing protein/prepilin-type processing-associated H-X9-DG protein
MPHQTPRNGGSAGFTLVELLVVISVIVLLMGMVLPVLQSSAARAREVKCLSNLSQLGKAIVTYSGNNDGFMPSPAHVNKEGDWDLNDDALFDGDRTVVSEEPKRYQYTSWTWKGKIIYYVGTVSLDEDELYQLYRCPSVRNFKGHKSFYGFNAVMGMHPGEVLRDTAGYFKMTHYDDIIDTSRTFLIGENNDGHWVVKPKYPPEGLTFTEVGESDRDYPGQVYEGQAYARHSHRGSWVYCDGHVEPLRLDKVHEHDCLYWLVEKPGYD